MVTESHNFGSCTFFTCYSYVTILVFTVFVLSITKLRVVLPQNILPCKCMDMLVLCNWGEGIPHKVSVHERSDGFTYMLSYRFTYIVQSATEMLNFFYTYKCLLCMFASKTKPMQAPQLPYIHIHVLLQSHLCVAV